MILALLLAASAPIVLPADPTAQFQGDGKPIKFDRACGDYTLTTVASDAACAARVARAEAAPALFIGIATMLKEPARATEALALLERALAAHDHPAIHYLLGTIYGNAERQNPDFAKARRHLTIAADRGNPAAADLLGTLLLLGKGGPRDVSQAVQRYEFAMGHGFPDSSLRLAELYLRGRFVPRDDEQARRILDAAAVAGVQQAASFKMMLDGSSKYTNYQLIPSPDDKAVRAIAYGIFDNPTIPPSFGFDPAFQAVHFAPFSDAATLMTLENTASSGPTPYLYELARRLSERDPARALQTYFVAKTRMTYDASRCADPAALEAVRAWDMIALPDLLFLVGRGATESVKDAVRKALAAEAALPGDTRPWWACRSGMRAMQAALENRPFPLEVKPVAEWPQLRRQARARLEAVLTPVPKP